VELRLEDTTTQTTVVEKEQYTAVTTADCPEWTASCMSHVRSMQLHQFPTLDFLINYSILACGPGCKSSPCAGLRDSGRGRARSTMFVIVAEPAAFHVLSEPAFLLSSSSISLSSRVTTQLYINSCVGSQRASPRMLGSEAVATSQAPKRRSSHHLLQSR
jgi:hypothetical protein